MSLHWILALTVTTLHFFTAHTNPTTNLPVLYTEFEMVIKDLKKHGCNENNSTFYSPSGTGECTIKALDCSTMELEKVKTECFEKNSMYKVDEANFFIQEILLTKKIKLQANPNNCFCGQEEVVKPYNDFLDNILKLVQMLNSRDGTK